MGFLAVLFVGLAASFCQRRQCGGVKVLMVGVEGAGGWSGGSQGRPSRAKKRR